MVVYAAMSAISLGFVAPFMRVLFERARPAATGGWAPAPGAPAAPAAAEGAARLIGWPRAAARVGEPRAAQRQPLVALERSAC
jgi:hypothetical protein